MAKKFYAPVSGSSKEVKKFYAPVNGSSVKIVKAYCSVGGVSKCFYEEGGEVDVPHFWFNYVTTAKKVIDGKRYTVVPNQVDVEIDTQGTGIVFYFFIQQTSGGSIVENLIIATSTDSNATYFNAICQGQTEQYATQDWFWLNQTMTEKWYYTVGSPIEYDYSPQYPADINPDCVVHDPVIAESNYLDSLTRQFVNKYIYANDFAEDYDVGNTYTFPFADIAKTLRKIIAVFLIKNVSLKSNISYSTLLTRLDDIVNTVLGEIGNANCCVFMLMFGSTSNPYIQINCWYDTLQSPITASPTDMNAYHGYTRFSLNPSAPLTNFFYTRIESDGTINTTTHSTSSWNLKVGVAISAYSDYKMCELSNVGLTLGVTHPFYVFHENYVKDQSYTKYSMPTNTYLRNIINEIAYFIGGNGYEDTADFIDEHFGDIYGYFTTDAPSHDRVFVQFGHYYRKSDGAIRLYIDVYYYSGSGYIKPSKNQEISNNYPYYTLTSGTYKQTSRRTYEKDYNGDISMTQTTVSFDGGSYPIGLHTVIQDATYVVYIGGDSSNLGIDLKAGFT